MNWYSNISRINDECKCVNLFQFTRESKWQKKPYYCYTRISPRWRDGSCSLAFYIMLFRLYSFFCSRKCFEITLDTTRRHEWWRFNGSGLVYMQCLLMAQHQSRQHQCKIQFNHLFTAHENMFNKCSHKYSTRINC